MGVLEWIGAHLLAPVVNLYRAIATRPRPEVRILELRSTGGGSALFFVAKVQNYGSQVARATATARVGSQRVPVDRATLDLLVNTSPTVIRINVPRPELVELMRECDHAATLYGRELVLEIVTGKKPKRLAWREDEYESVTDRERFEIQQRYWRRGRGEETTDDRRTEAIQEYEERRDRGDDGDDLIDV